MLQSKWLYAVVFILVPARLLCNQSRAWHLPVLPAGCPGPAIAVELLDSGRAMARNGAFPQAQQEAAHQIEEIAPNCTLEIVASFDTIAEIRGAAVLVDDSSRQFLAGVVMEMTPSQRASSNEAAARLIGSLNGQLHAAYGALADRLVVRVYSDFDRAGQTGNANASPGRLLAQQIHARYAGQAELESGTVPAPPLAATPVTPPVAEAKPRSPWPWATAVVGALLLAGLCLVCRVRLQRRDSAPRSGALVALVVNEAVDGHLESPAITCSDRRIEVAAGVPVVFSTEPASATFIAAEVEGGPNGELFRIVPMSDGTLRIRSPHPELTADGEAVRGEHRMRLNAAGTLRLRLEEREYMVRAIFGRQAATAREDLFDAEALHL